MNRTAIDRWLAAHGRERGSGRHVAARMSPAAIQRWAGARPRGVRSRALASFLEARERGENPPVPFAKFRRRAKG